MTKPQTAHVVFFDGQTVVRKQAIGPERTATGWDAPVVPVGGVVITPARYAQIALGWQRINGAWVPPVEATPVRMAERFIRMETRLRALAARVTALEQR